jgi:hypothetical protein
LRAHEQHRWAQAPRWALRLVSTRYAGWMALKSRWSAIGEAGFTK